MVPFSNVKKQLPRPTTHVVDLYLKGYIRVARCDLSKDDDTYDCKTSFVIIWWHLTKWLGKRMRLKWGKMIRQAAKVGAIRGAEGKCRHRKIAAAIQYTYWFHSNSDTSEDIDPFP